MKSELNAHSLYQIVEPLHDVNVRKKNMVSLDQELFLISVIPQIIDINHHRVAKNIVEHFVT